MNERSLPDDGRICDEPPKAIGAPPPDTRTAVAPAAGRPSLPVAMPGPDGRPLPFGFTRGGLLAVGAAFLVSLCLFAYGIGPMLAVLNPKPGSETILGCSPVLAVFAGGSLMGGAVGTVIGQLFRDEKGGAAVMGAFVGTLAGPLIVAILLLAYGFVFGGGMSV
jgi:hypothetical protein